MFISPAFAQGASMFGGSDNMLVSLLPFVLIFVIMYFLILRPQQKRQKQHADMGKNVRRGDTVITSGGLVGKVTKVIDDDQIEVGGDVLGSIPARHGNPFRREKITHRWVDILVGPPHVETLPLQHGGQRRHRRATNPDQVHARHSTAASSMINRGCGPPITRQSTPNGNVTAGAVVWPEGNPKSTGP